MVQMMNRRKVRRRQFHGIGQTGSETLSDPPLNARGTGGAVPNPAP